MASNVPNGETLRSMDEEYYWSSKYPTFHHHNKLSELPSHFVVSTNNNNSSNASISPNQNNNPNISVNYVFSSFCFIFFTIVLQILN